MDSTKLSSTLSRYDYITDEHRFIEIVSVDGQVHGLDVSTDKYVTLQIIVVDDPEGNWRKVTAT